MPPIQSVFSPHIREADIELTIILIIMLVGDMTVFLVIIELVDAL
jgi:hypothetical protein